MRVSPYAKKKKIKEGESRQCAAVRCMVCEQGPCHKGDLVVVNPVTTEAYCSCDPDLLSQYFYPPLKLCYEHFTKVHHQCIELILD
jgi:hypothetical protein